MPLSENILDKIRYLYEITSHVKEYWVRIQLWQCEKYQESTLEIDVYTFLENAKQATLYKTKIELNEPKAEKKIQQAIDNIKELITPTSNEND